MADHIETDHVQKDSKISQVREHIKKIVSKMPADVPIEEKKEQAKVLVKIFEKNMSPKEAMNISDEEISVFYSYAYQLFNSGKYPEACELFKMLYNLDPTEGGFASGVGACYHKMRDYEKALVMYLIHSQIAPLDPAPLLYCYDCYMHLNNPEGAYLMLFSAIRRAGIEPEYAKLKDKAEALLEGFDYSSLNGFEETVQDIADNGGI